LTVATFAIQALATCPKVPIGKSRAHNKGLGVTRFLWVQAVRITGIVGVSVGVTRLLEQPMLVVRKLHCSIQVNTETAPALWTPHETALLLCDIAVIAGRQDGFEKTLDRCRLYQLNKLDELTTLAYIDFERWIVMPVTKTTASESPNIALSMKLPRKADFEKALLKQYTKAVQLSQKAGHQVSFRVVVDPLAGAQTISIVEEDPLAREGEFPVEEVRAPDVELEAALAAARERGRRRVAEILGEDDMLNADSFSGLLGVSRVTVNAKRQNGQVLGLDGAKRGFRFPAWQLDQDGRLYAALPKLHEILSGAWAVYRFLVSPHGALDGRTALDALKRGQDSDVIAAAKGVARGDFR
jgi:hypothetical protein